MREFDTNGLRLAEYQAKLFEASHDRFKCSSSVILRRFLHSELLERMDKNNSAILSLDVIEGLNDIEDEFGISEYGNTKYNYDSLFWVGYMYRYISYTRNVSTIFLFKTFDYKKLFELYYPLHTQDPEWVIRSLLELYNLNEDYFDPNYRFKEELRKRVS